MSSDWLRVAFLLSKISSSIGLFVFNILGQCQNIFTMENEDVDHIVFQTICKSVFMNKCCFLDLISFVPH